jgi:hypothetical protein
MTIIENWMNAHRLSRAVFLAIALGGLLLWELWNPPPRLVSRSTQVGEVVSVAESGMIVIALADGKRVRTLSLQPVPKSGDKITMVVETYEDGTARAFVDEEVWRTGESLGSNINDRSASGASK